MTAFAAGLFWMFTLCTLLQMEPGRTACCPNNLKYRCWEPNPCPQSLLCGSSNPEHCGSLYFPFTGNRTLFVHCGTAGTCNVHECAPGTAWDETSNICMLAVGVDRRPAVAPVWQPVVRTPRRHLPADPRTGHMGSPSSPKVEGACCPGSLLHPCLGPNPCPPDLPCDSNGTCTQVYFPFQGNKSLFIQCGHGQQCHVLDCARGTVWNQSESRCTTSMTIVSPQASMPWAARRAAIPPVLAWAAPRADERRPLHAFSRARAGVRRDQPANVRTWSSVVPQLDEGACCPGNAEHPCWGPNPCPVVMQCDGNGTCTQRYFPFKGNSSLFIHCGPARQCSVFTCPPGSIWIQSETICNFPMENVQPQVPFQMSARQWTAGAIKQVAPAPSQTTRRRIPGTFQRDVQSSSSLPATLPVAPGGLPVAPGGLPVAPGGLPMGVGPGVPSCCPGNLYLPCSGPNPCQQGNQGFFPFKGTNILFIQCGPGTNCNVLQCPVGTIWNQRRFRCILPEELLASVPPSSVPTPSRRRQADATRQGAPTRRRNMRPRTQFASQRDASLPRTIAAPVLPVSPGGVVAPQRTASRPESGWVPPHNAHLLPRQPIAPRAATLPGGLPVAPGGAAVPVESRWAASGQTRRWVPRHNVYPQSRQPVARRRSAGGFLVAPGGAAVPVAPRGSTGRSVAPRANMRQPVYARRPPLLQPIVRPGEPSCCPGHPDYPCSGPNPCLLNVQCAVDGNCPEQMYFPFKGIGTLFIQCGPGVNCNVHRCPSRSFWNQTLSRCIFPEELVTIRQRAQLPARNTRPTILRDPQMDARSLPVAPGAKVQPTHREQVTARNPWRPNTSGGLRRAVPQLPRTNLRQPAYSPLGPPANSPRHSTQVSQSPAMQPVSSQTNARVPSKEATQNPVAEFCCPGSAEHPCTLPNPCPYIPRTCDEESDPGCGQSIYFPIKGNNAKFIQCGFEQACNIHVCGPGTVWNQTYKVCRLGGIPLFQQTSRGSDARRGLPPAMIPAQNQRGRRGYIGRTFK